MELTVDQQAAGVSGNYRIIFTVENLSSDTDAQRVQVRIYMPNNADPVGNSATNGTVTQVSDGYIWEIGQVKKGKSHKITVVVTNPQGAADYQRRGHPRGRRPQPFE